MLTLNGPQASASGVRAARWLIALPVVMLLFHLLLWLRYGTDLPFYDDWTGYVSGDIKFQHRRLSCGVGWLGCRHWRHP